MSIEPVKTFVRNIPQNLLAETNKVGSFVTSKIPFMGRGADTFVSKTKLNVNRNTLVGGGVILAALVLAFGCIKSIHSKVTELQKEK